MTRPTQVPGIPRPPSRIDAETKRYLEALAEAVEIRLGRRGDPIDRAVTLRELIDSGLAKRLASSPYDPNNAGSDPGFGPDPNVNTGVPTAPTNFTANGAYSQVNLFWDVPLYGNHGNTEIWSHTSDTIGDATLAGVASGGVYIDPVGGGVTRYYWARHVSTSNINGPYNSSTGTIATTATNPAAILAELTGSISVSHLTSSLAGSIDGSGSAIDISNLESFVGFASSYNPATDGSLLGRIGGVESTAAGLATTYGSTTSAAASAASANTASAAAIAAKVAALSAQAGAVTAEDNAETAETSAETAQAAAETAQTAASTSATGAAGSASSATNSQTAAANSASTSGNAATAAATSESNAQTYATNAGTASTASTASKVAAESARAGAASSATAAATSETNAATAATAAGTASSVANTAKLAAETAKAGAETAETNAASSETNASGSQSAASQSATNAANSASASGVSAGAAATSASTATSKATDAAQESASATVAKNAAETAKANAETAESNAASSASTASGSASTASSAAQNAAQSESDAGAAASAASSSASSASTFASAAGTASAASVSAKLVAESASATASGYSATAAASATAANDSSVAAASTVSGLTARLNNAGGTGVTVEEAYSVAAGDISGLEAQYSVKIDNNGHVSGFGLASVEVDGVPESAFVIRADKFAIVDPASTANNTTNTPSADSIPFGVTSGVVYIKSAAIEDASITAAKIGSINADTITTGSMSANKIIGGTIDASQVTVAGVSPSFEIKSASTGARMEIKADVIKVFDSSNQLRVKLGNLS